jgi:hypothetical protein
MARDELPDAASLIPSKGYIPAWAAELLRETRQLVSSDPEDRSSNYSLVMPYIGDDASPRDEEDR